MAATNPTTRGEPMGTNGHAEIAPNGIRIRRAEFAPDPHGKTGTSKRLKYRWTELPPEGEFARIPKDQLYVDPSYQREHSEAKAREMAADWEWIRCPTLMVVQRLDGTLFVVDGQHRAIAASKRDDIEDLPCLVFDVRDVSEEASAFFKLNTSRSAVPIMAQYRARCIARDAGAVSTEEVMRAAGMRFGNGGRGTIQAIRLVMKMVKEDRDLALKSLLLAKEVAGDNGVNGDVLHAMFWIARHDASVLEGVHAARLTEAGQGVLLNEINRHRAITATGGVASNSKPIVALLNKGRRSHRIEVGAN